MTNRSVKRLVSNLDLSVRVLKKRGSYLYDVLNRYQSQWPISGKPESDAIKDVKEASRDGLNPKADGASSHSHLNKYSSDEDDPVSNKWKPEVAWISKALEPALQLYKWAVPAGNGAVPTNRSISEIFASIQRSKAGLQEWSFGDLTLGLYLMYLQQPSRKEDVKGEPIFSETIVMMRFLH